MHNEERSFIYKTRYRTKFDSEGLLDLTMNRAICRSFIDPPGSDLLVNEIGSRYCLHGPSPIVANGEGLCAGSRWVRMGGQPRPKPGYCWLHSWTSAVSTALVRLRFKAGLTPQSPVSSRDFLVMLVAR
jgi:hypothetical protein